MKDLELFDEFIMQKCTGKAFVVKQGQSFRVIEIEGKQVASLIFFNAHNYKEQFMAEFSGGLNYFHPEHLGSHYRATKLYSKVPYENEMLSLTDNKIGDHFLGPPCTKTIMETLGEPDHRSCSDNFVDALKEFDIKLEDIYSPSAFNAFANIYIDTDGDGKLNIYPPRSETGDYLEFTAHMDILVVASACPDDVSPINDHECKAIKFQIFNSTNSLST